VTRHKIAVTQPDPEQQSLRHFLDKAVIAVRTSLLWRAGLTPVQTLAMRP
jgi:hypothetical protein